MATKQVSVRMAAVGGKQVKAELIEIGAAGQRSFRQLDGAARMSGGGLQNVGFQVQDFAVQVAGGTDATRALAQQLPQLLSGFGLFGVLIGTASAVLIPFAGYLFDAGDNAGEAATKIGELENAVKELKAANEVFDLSGIDALIEKYGELDAAVVLMLTRQQQAKEQAVLDSARAAVAGIGAQVQEIEGILRAYDNFITASLSDPQWAINALAEADALTTEFGLTTEQARQLVATLDELRGASGLAEAATIAADLQGQIEGTNLAGGELSEQLRAVEDAARQGAKEMAGMSGYLGSAVDTASQLASQLWNAAGAFFSIGNGQARAAQQIAASEQLTYSGRGADPRQFIEGASGSFNRSLFEVPTVRRAGGGGGGGGGASDDEREAQRIFEQTRTEAEKYATELARINELHDSGALSTDTFNRAMDQLKEKTGEANDTAKQLNQSFADTFTSIITGSSSASEAISQLLGNLASQLASSAFDGFFGKGGVFGAEGIGGLLGGIFGGGKAGGGSVCAGMSYMVGENGPERITMGGNGYVTTNAELRRSATQFGGGLSIAIDARGAVEGVAEQIERRLRAFAPELIQQSVSASRAAAGRGR